jgi:hypothetical protein
MLNNLYSASSILQVDNVRRRIREHTDITGHYHRFMCPCLVVQQDPVIRLNMNLGL